MKSRMMFPLAAMLVFSVLIIARGLQLPSLKSIKSKELFPSVNIKSIALSVALVWNTPSTVLASEVFIPDTQVLRQPLSLKGSDGNYLLPPPVTDSSSNLDRKFINKVIALVPILQLRQEISTLKLELQSLDEKLLTESISKESIASIYDTWNRISNILGKDKYNIKPLKLTFNSYADNIFVSADQVKAGQGTGMPSLLQTNQYLIRNSIITGLSDLREDIAAFDAKLLLKDDTSNEAVQSLRTLHIAEDALSDCTAVLRDFAQYVALTDPTDYEQASRALAAQ